MKQIYKYAKNPPLLGKAIARTLKERQIPSIAKYFSFAKTHLNLTPAEIAKPGIQWDRLLNEIVNEMKASPMTFLRRPVISRPVHPNQQDLARHYLDEQCASSFFVEHILPRIHETPMGDPYLCDFFPFASPMTMQHVYYLNLMKDKFGLFVPNSEIAHVVDVGAGYGNFCRIVKSFGFQGKYIIVDFPAMQEIQRHYLNHVLPQNIQANKIEFRTPDDLEILPFDEHPAILLATFSINEMPLETRKIFERRYQNFDYLFFAYNAAYEGIDNRKYFDALAQCLESMFHIEHFADGHRPAWFLLCRRKH